MLYRAPLGRCNLLEHLVSGQAGALEAAVDAGTLACRVLDLRQHCTELLQVDVHGAGHMELDVLDVQMAILCIYRVLGALLVLLGRLVRGIPMPPREVAQAELDREAAIGDEPRVLAPLRVGDEREELKDGL